MSPIGKFNDVWADIGSGVIGGNAYRCSDARMLDDWARRMKKAADEDPNCVNYFTRFDQSKVFSVVDAGFVDPRHGPPKHISLLHIEKSYGKHFNAEDERAKNHEDPLDFSVGLTPTPQQLKKSTSTSSTSTSSTSTSPTSNASTRSSVQSNSENTRPSRAPPVPKRPKVPKAPKKPAPTPHLKSRRRKTATKTPDGPMKTSAVKDGTPSRKRGRKRKSAVEPNGKPPVVKKRLAAREILERKAAIQNRNKVKYARSQTVQERT